MFGLVILFLWVTSAFGNTNSSKEEPTATDKMIGGVKSIIFVVFIVLGLILIALMITGGL